MYKYRNIVIHEDEIGTYIKKLIKTNEKLLYWNSFLENKYKLKDNFRYKGINLWDVFIGNMAPNDLFSANTQKETNSKSKFCFNDVIKTKLSKLFIILFTYFGFFKHTSTIENEPIIFIAYERRQISTFIKTIGNLLKNKTSFNIITTKFNSHEFPKDYSFDNKTLFLESFWPSLPAYLNLFNDYYKLRSFLNCFSLDNYNLSDKNELEIIISFMKNNLLNVLIMIDSSFNFLNFIKPKSLISADNADLRIRTLYLAAKLQNIKTYHLTYGFVGYDCFEEKYMVADKKIVYGERQKDLVVNHFEVERDNLFVLGCPRFDDLFLLRNSIMKTKKDIFTILFGSQPQRRGAYGLITEDIKISKIDILFETLSLFGNKIKLYIKPHPDETKEEISSIKSLAFKHKLNFEIIDNIDFKKASNEVDFFTTFFSTLGLEFMIVNIPVCFLLSVKNIPILHEACLSGLSFELTDSTNLAKRIKDFMDNQNSENKLSKEDFLKKEFTNTRGTTSEELAVFLEN